MDTCGCCWRAINSIHVKTEQSVICWLGDCWEVMDTKLFVLLPEMFPFPLFETATATSYSRSWSPSEQREHSTGNWRCMSSGFKRLFSIIVNQARLMNNLGCDWALPDGWNEMPPLTFHQLGEVVIPTGWWLLFWSTDVHKETTKYPWVMYSSCGGTTFPSNPLVLSSLCPHR